MIPAYADAIDNTINIGTTIYTVVNDPKYSNNTFTPAAGAHNEIVSNKLSIFYNALTTTQINAPDLTLEKNILDLAEGYSFSQTNKVPVAAVELRFTNNNSLYSTDLTNFAPAVKDNTLNVTYYSTDLSGVQGNLFGALVETENSNIGSLVISSNTVNSAINTNETGTQIFGAEVILNASGTGAVPVMTTDLTDNKVNITDGTLRNEVIGGEILGVIKDNGQGMNISGNVKDNIVTITKGTIVTPVVGGVLAVDSKNDSKTINLTGNVTGNELVINGGLYQTGAILVGGSLSLEGYGAKEDSVITSAVQNNKITISGGDFYNTLIVGGVTTSDNKRTSNNATAAQTTGAISGNTIEISGTANISDSYSWLSGGFTTGTNSYKNNTLILKKSGISVYGVDGFDTYEFDVTGAGNGTVYLSSAHGNGHNNTLYRQFDLSTTNGAWDIDGATVNWSTSDGKRPAYLTLGGSAVLLQETSGLGLSGTLTNAETTTDFTDGGVTYTYLLRQSPTSVYLLHNKLTATDWNDNVFVSAGNYSGDDVSMIISGTLKAPSITVASNAAAAATLTAGTLDVTANDTLLNLTAAQDMHKNATFTTINIDNGHNLTKAGNAFYTFTNMNVNSDAQISSLDVVQNAATATLKSGTNTTIGVINLINGGALTLSGAGNYTFDTFNT